MASSGTVSWLGKQKHLVAWLPHSGLLIFIFTRFSSLMAALTLWAGGGGDLWEEAYALNTCFPHPPIHL